MLKLKSKFLIQSKFLNKARTVFKVVSLFDEKSLKALFKKHLRSLITFATLRGSVSPRVRHCWKFLELMLKTNRHHGALYTCKWLKANHVAIQRFLAGHPYRTLREIEPNLPLTRLINGLPGFIGSMDRKAIRSGNTRTIRFWNTILSVYRVLDAPVNPKLNTITDPFNGDSEFISLFRHWISGFIGHKNNFALLKRGINIQRLKADHLRVSVKGGPNNSPAYTSVHADALSIFRDPQLTKAIREYCHVTAGGLWDLLVRTKEIAHSLYREYEGFTLEQSRVAKPPGFAPFKIPRVIEGWDTFATSKGMKSVPNMVQGDYTDLYAGKLHGIVEPAGKLRVIAMVDIWTQSLFHPLHKTLFSILARLPNDGTFNQELSVKRSAEKAATSGLAFSVDLSSATDRLPIMLQEDILNALFGHRIGTLWRTILNRPFVQRQSLAKNFRDGESIWYGTGQPMGCLSSWAMLALTHHCILQFCARSLTNHSSWFTGYEILGDDLVIFDRDVYNEYIRVMGLLDVETNPSKTLVSESSQTFEFAKRTVTKGVDVSGLSWKQFITNTSLKDRISMTLYLASRGLLLSTSQLSKIIGDIHSSRLKDTEVSQGLLISLLNHCASKGVLSYREAISYIWDPVAREADELKQFVVPIKMTMLDLVKLLNKLHREIDDSPVSMDDLSINRIDDRKAYGAMYIIPYLSNYIIRGAVARAFAYEQEFGNLHINLVPDLVRSYSDLKIIRKPSDGLPPIPESVMQVIDDNDSYDTNLYEVAQSLVFQTSMNEPTSGIIGKAYEKLSEPRYNDSLWHAIDFKDWVESFVSKYTFMKQTRMGADLKDSPNSWLQADLYRSTDIPRSSPYYAMIAGWAPSLTDKAQQAKQNASPRSRFYISDEQVYWNMFKDDMITDWNLFRMLYYGKLSWSRFLLVLIGFPPKEDPKGMNRRRTITEEQVYWGMYMDNAATLRELFSMWRSGHLRLGKFVHAIWKNPKGL
jgi:hypothetical protein